LIPGFFENMTGMMLSAVPEGVVVTESSPLLLAPCVTFCRI
jgi:hypothetical protein